MCFFLTLCLLLVRELCLRLRDMVTSNEQKFQTNFRPKFKGFLKRVFLEKSMLTKFTGYIPPPSNTSNRNVVEGKFRWDYIHSNFFVDHDHIGIPTSISNLKGDVSDIIIQGNSNVFEY